MKTAKIAFKELGLQKKTVSDAGTNFTSDIFRQLCRKMNIKQSITSSYYHQSNGQVEVCIKFLNVQSKNALILIKM